jgi:thiamine-phosphate diphosphorylase
MMYELNKELNYDEMTEQEVIDYVRYFLRTEYRISENYVGFRYLLCAIIMLLEDREYLNFITKSLYVEIAVKCKADGIHVGQEDMMATQVRQMVGEDMMIGVSVHSVEEALEAVRNGADCLGVGAMFSTSTKTDADVLPKEVLKEICDAVDIPVVAIGGISKENMAELKGTGVDGVALVSAIFAAEDIEEECCILRQMAEEMVQA